MDNLARPEMDDAYGVTFARSVMSEGSIGVVKPLTAFLGDRGERADLRAAAKTARAALIADIAHFINISHGRHPGVIDHAAHKIVDDAARKWLVEAIDGFAAERAYLNRLTVIAGPIHRLNSQDKVTALIAGQAKNFAMLATSDRKGCPAGASIAFVIDWLHTRALLDTVALHVGLDAPAPTLPNVDACTALADQLGQDANYRRAMAFGSSQILAQQRGLWQLIAARHTEMLAS